MTRRAIVLVGLAIAALAIITAYIIFSSFAVAPIVDPQRVAYESLKEESLRPPELYFQQGFPRGVLAQVRVEGEDAVERARNFLTTYQDLYLQNDPALALAVKQVGETSTAVTFYQTYKGLPVFGGEIVVTLAEELVFGTVGGLLPAEVELETTPAIADRDAEDFARQHLGLPPDAPVSGETRLMVFDPGLLSDVPSDPHLAWRVTFGNPYSLQALVDAHTAELLLSYSLVQTGEGLEDFDLQLEDAENDANAADDDCFWTSDDYTIGDEDSFDSDYNNDPDAVNAWNFARQAYLFYHDNFGRHSYDNDDGQIEVFIHSTLSPAPNAKWVPGTGCDLIEFSNGMVGDDVLVHEFTHGVIRYTSGLVYVNQSGALNESYADVMAALATADWVMGESTVSGAFRSMSNPPAFADPDHMSEFVTTTSDNGGVHTNSGIHNFVAFLITMGGTHPDSGVTVNGIGPSKAMPLFYSTMKSLPLVAQFIDARNATVQTAQFFYYLATCNESSDSTCFVIHQLLGNYGYGFTQFDVCAVRNAFFAVGLGNPDIDCDGKEDNPDKDGDSIPFGQDNCPAIFNPSQLDTDKDGFGNACDGDPDEDGFPDGKHPIWGGDNCPGLYNPDQTDANFNGKGKACDPTEDDDFDDDGVKNWEDNCPFDYNPDQADVDSSTDLTGWGDACDPDSDGDGWSNDDDNCPFTPNPDQANSDGDFAGDACDPTPDCPDVYAWSAGYDFGDFKTPPKPIADPDLCNQRYTLDDSIYGRVVDDLLPDGSDHHVEITNGDDPYARLPLPDCPMDDPQASSPEYRGHLLLSGLDPSLGAWVVNDEGQTIGKPPRGLEPRSIRYPPWGSQGQSLVLGLFGLGLGERLEFTLSWECGPKSEVTPPSPEPTPTPTPTLEPSPTPTFTPTPTPTFTPTPTPTFTPTPTPVLPQCSDGIDNDGDGRADFFLGTIGLGDPECRSAEDDDEAVP